MNFKKLGIVLFLLIAVIGFSLSSVNAGVPGPDVRDGGNYTLYTQPYHNPHSVTFDGIAGFDIANIYTVTPVDSNNVISWTKNSNGSYTFTGVKESNTPVSYAVALRNPYTGQVITIIYTFNKVINDPDLRIPVFIGGDTSNYLSVSSQWIKHNDYVDYDSVKGKNIWTQLVMNDDIKRIHAEWLVPWMWRFSSDIYADEWGKDINNIEHLEVYSHYKNDPYMKLFLKDGTVIKKGY
jgi:hypothetical protein